MVIVKQESPTPPPSPTRMDVDRIRRQAPKIEGEEDLLLDVYTHKSLQKPGMQDNDYGDTERLALLGEKILDMVVCSYFFKKSKPMRTAQQIRQDVVDTLTTENYNRWLEQHHLKGKLRFAPNVDPNPLQDPQELRHYFNTFVGAVFLRSGVDVVNSWIVSLLDPTAVFNPADVAEQQTTPIATSSNAPPPYLQSHTQYQPQLANPPPPPPPPPPAAMPPPMPAQPPPPPPMSHSPPRANGLQFLPTLALVNQTAAQRGLQITYEADSFGPPHQPTWTVRCLINGHEQGRGTGRNQKQAKEEAARQAWVNMRW
ncbi:ribonuclease iii [Moniliophthora roreri MCA 2997]|uniref:Ribonuclease iii n=1 Tax=Moniliophthora roreri (strain MCA 2997) TaxID=1381753 RepID=V2XDL2_MONRO|nr:ribonuclease iii [Moniliophthora roreri MCA 2997]